MTMSAQQRVRIGYVAGQARRVNERAIDGEWAACLRDYADVVSIPPLSFMKLFGGSLERWIRRLPDSVGELGERLRGLCERHRIQAMYINLPVIMPYLMMARNEAGLNLSFICIAHAVGTEFWLRHWIGSAPLLTERDVLLVSSSSALQAMLNISPVYRRATLIPLCIRLRDTGSEGTDAGILPCDSSSSGTPRRLLAIGRIESVKNIHVLLRCFAAMREQANSRGIELKLTIAGEYTGPSDEAVASYRALLAELLDRFELHDAVTFTGPVSGEVKDRLFRESHLLLNLSTDIGETFGYNLLEAKVWGIPVVCTAWDGFRDLVADGMDGTMVPCRWEDGHPVIDEQTVVEACIDLLTDEDRRRRYARYARLRAEQFDHRRIIPRILQAVERAVAYPGQPDYGAWKRRCFETPIRSLPELYRLPLLAQLPFLDRTPAAVLSLDDCRDSDWPAWVEPIIGHYGGSDRIGVH